MQVSLENTGSIGRKMTITIPAERMESRVAERLSTVGKNVNLPGFRPGKAPRKLIESKYGPAVLGEVAEQLINETYREALGENNVVPATSPKIEAKKLARGEDLEYVAEFDVFPEIQRSDLKGETISRPVCEVADEDINQTIETLRQRQVNWVETDDASADGDKVKVDFNGTIDGEAFGGGEATDFDIVLGQGSMLPEFEAAVVGAKNGDEKTAEVSFPEDYHGKDVAGKTASFQISVKQVFHPELPEINEEFIKSLGVEEASEEALKAEVRKNLERELNDRIRANVKNQVMDKLIELNPVDLPGELVEQEIDRMVQSTQERFAQQGLKDFPVERQPLEADARRRVALGLIVHDVVQSNSISLDEDKLKARVDEMASSYESPEEFVHWHYADRSRLANFEAMVLEEQVVDFLLDSAETEDKNVTFQEFVNSGS